MQMFLRTLAPSTKTIACRTRGNCLRCYATASSLDPRDIRNIALLAHIDSGKTTLTESILHASSYLTAPGSVDTGSTTTDFLPAERERGITIQSASIPVHWKRWTFNLIDTPGHADFGMEVESASRVIDGAVVLLDAVEGVEGQTKGVWRQLDRHSVPTRMIFLNKLDRTGASFNSSLLSMLNHRLHPKPAVLTLPIASFDPQKYDTAEPGIEGIVDLVNWEVWRWKPSNESTYAAAESVSRSPLPLTEEALSTTFESSTKSHPMIAELLPARMALIHTLCDSSPELMDALLELPDKPSPYLMIPKEKLMSALRQLTLDRTILPIVCGAALKHVGTEILLNYVGELLASPFDVTVRDPKDLVAGVRKNAIQKREQLQVLAWKVSWDKRKGWMTFVRVYSGTLNAQSSLINTTNRQKERVSKVMLFYASQPEEVEALSFGGVGVILGLKHTRTGDTLTSMSWNESDAPSTLRSITPPPSVISASVVPHSRSDVEPVQEALQSLARTDPSLRVTEDVQEGQTLVHGLGALHLEIVEGRLKDEWGVKLQFGKRRVTYRENFRNEDPDGVTKESRWERDVGGKHMGASITMTVRALHEDATDPFHHQFVETWGGNSVTIRDKAGELIALPSPDSSGFDNLKFPSTSVVASLLQGISSGLTSSPHTLLPLSYLNITISSFSLDQGSPPSALTAAAAGILRTILMDAGAGRIMEPFVRVKVDVGDETLGKVVKDLTEHGGEIQDLGSGMITDDNEVGPYSQDGLYIPPKWLTPSSSGTRGSEVTASIKRSIHAVAPLARMLDYSSRLRAVSGGQAVFEMSNAGFRSVGEARRIEILKDIGRL
ncbi:Ribosome-releasing factor 2, mitochondrial [Tulasnella sp. 331]|nr:Ribosome-releasing factor 2, mitochondrial [Tulasnella sp. 331]